MKNYNILQRIKVKLLGWDFFISYRRSDSYGYMKALDLKLREANISCFIDESEIIAGEALPVRIQNGLLNSKKMIFIASPQAVTFKDKDKKDWIEEEINSFSKKIITINVNDSLSNFQNNKLNNKDTVYISESIKALFQSLPSEDVIQAIIKEIRYNTINRQANLILTILFSFCLLGVYGYYHNASESNQNRRKILLSTLTGYIEKGKTFKSNGFPHYSDSLYKSVKNLTDYDEFKNDESVKIKLMVLDKLTK
jgi:hypothetical protein